MRIGILGCGYVADYYMATLPSHPELELCGIYDIRPERIAAYHEHYDVHAYDSYQQMLDDERVELIVNLTNPREHFETTKAALEAGKHVYSEKPLSMEMEKAETLVALANERGLRLSSAPCSLLGEAAQTMWKALRENKIGTVRLVYAELDTGFIPKMPYETWVTHTGSPWPYRDEFEVGCTVEHAGYYLTWLTAFFGPAKRVTSFASTLMPNKGVTPPLDVMTPDFAVGCIEFHSGVVARITCGIIAEHDHTLKIFGDDGALCIDDCWDYHLPVHISKRKTGKRRETLPLVSTLIGHGKRKFKHLESPNGEEIKKLGMMDFMRGPAEMAAAIKANRPHRLSAEHALHVNEITLALQHPDVMGTVRELTTTFDPIEPMEWAV